MKYLDKLKDELPSGTLFKVGDIGADSFEHRYFHLPYEGNKNGGYYQGVPINFKEYKYKPYANFINLVKEYNNVGYEGGVQLRNGKKPEALIDKVIEIAGIEKGDIVLDFFLGSGTTAAVAHKKGFQYIGIEQLDYGENNPSERLKKVINGDQTGISNKIDWNGGGNFVYCELIKWNEKFIDQIQETNNIDELLKIYKNIKQKAFLNYKFDIEEFEKDNMKNFKKLELPKQKEILLNCLDLNQLYINLSEIEDSEYNISDNDKKLNKLFYEGDRNGRS